MYGRRAQARPQLLRLYVTALSIKEPREHVCDNKGYAASRPREEQGNGYCAAFAQGSFGDCQPTKPDPTDATNRFKAPRVTKPIRRSTRKVNPLEDPIVEATPQLNDSTPAPRSSRNALTPPWGLALAITV